jgi:hypothetical protein
MKILKNLIGSVQFYKSETEKTKPNRTQTEKTRKKTRAKQEKNQAKPV